MRRRRHARPGRSGLAHVAAALAVSLLTGATAGLALARWPLAGALDS